MSLNKTNTSIFDFSGHLFWDVDINKLCFEKNRKFIIHRVLDYGLINDWQIISAYYGIDQIAEVAITIKDLDKKAMTFISLLSKIPKENFLCYTTQQSIPKHWNF